MVSLSTKTNPHHQCLICVSLSISQLSNIPECSAQRSQKPCKLTALALLLPNNRNKGFNTVARKPCTSPSTARLRRVPIAPRHVEPREPDMSYQSNLTSRPQPVYLGIVGHLSISQPIGNVSCPSKRITLNKTIFLVDLPILLRFTSPFLRLLLS